MGGVNPQGEIVFDLFVEKGDLESTLMRVEPGQQPIELSRKGETVVREAQVGIVLRADIALMIGKWLMEKAREAGVIELRAPSSSLAS
jgi:hypothetical protein